MKLYRRFAGSSDFRAGSVVTIGNYDGVHLGHQALLALVCEQSRKLGLPSCVMSFEPMPSEFFGASGQAPLADPPGQAAGPSPRALTMNS